MRPSFEQFVAALREPSQRAGIGLVIGDADAAALLGREDWARGYFDKWIAMFPRADVAEAAEVAPAAPAEVEPAEVVAPEAPPVAAPGSLAAPAPTVPTAATAPRSRVPLVIAGTVIGAAVLAALAVFGLTQLTDALFRLGG